MFVPGEIVIAAFPFAALSGTKRRPCLVLAAGDSIGDFLVAFITSNVGLSHLPSATGVLPTHPGWRATGLKVPSVVRADKLATLNDTVIAGAIGTLPQDLLEEVRRKLKQLLGIP
jgi:mRNA interferase MazF